MNLTFSLNDLAAAEACFAEVSRLLYCEPDGAAVAAQVVGRQFSEAPFGGTNPWAARGLDRMDRWCADALAEAGEAALAADSVSAEALAAAPLFGERVRALRREWLRLFAGVGAPEASCLESFYVEPNRHMFGRNTLAVREAYRAWGLQVENLHREPDDHLGLMLGFLAHLIGEEARACEADDEATAAAAVRDQEALLAGHVLPWLFAWRFLVEEHAASDYYRGLGDFTFGLVAAYAERFGILFDEESERFRKAA